jgi:hypothetical protein
MHWWQTSLTNPNWLGKAYMFISAITAIHTSNEKCNLIINPNPHGFKAINKFTALGWKEPVLPNPLHSTLGGGGCFSAALKICLIKKTWITLRLSSKAQWKWRFNRKSMLQNSLLRYFARHLSHPVLISVSVF